jgi:hypothetical protein
MSGIDRRSQDAGSHVSAQAASAATAGKPLSLEAIGSAPSTGRTRFAVGDLVADLVDGHDAAANSTSM